MKHSVHLYIGTCNKTEVRRSTKYGHNEQLNRAFNHRYFARKTANMSAQFTLQRYNWVQRAIIAASIKKVKLILIFFK